nr:MAG TPA: hypothetical protein [Caudoviricetes sp.]
MLDKNNKRLYNVLIRIGPDARCILPKESQYIIEALSCFI